jgi:hypothetical protein
VPILRSVKNQGAYTNSYTILKKPLLILLFISYSLEDEADQNQNEVQEITKDTNQNIGTVVQYFQPASLFLKKIVQSLEQDHYKSFIHSTIVH